MKEAFVSYEKLQKFIRDVLVKAGARDDVAVAVAEGLVQTSLRGVDSHGIRLLPHYVESLIGGRVNPRPQYCFKKTSLSTGTLDADHTFGHAAGIEGAQRAVELAKEAGTAHIAIYNSNHFGAAAYYAFRIAQHDMIGMVFSNTDSLVKTYGGKRTFFGNNPLCMVVPMEGEEPFCLDMATSVMTFNKVKHLQEKKMQVPTGVGANADGIDTTDPNEVTMLLPMGGYKGYGLSMAVEILSSLLTGMPYGPYIPKMFEAPMSERRYLGHFVSAMRIDCFQESTAFKKRFAGMVNEIRNEPRLENDVPIQIPGDPEKKICAERRSSGIPIDGKLFKQFVAFGKQYKTEFPMA